MTAYNLIEPEISFVNGEKKYGLVNEKGKWVAEPIFDELGDEFDEHGLLQARIGNKWGCINRRGKWVVKPEFESFADPIFDEKGMHLFYNQQTELKDFIPERPSLLE